MNERPVDGGPIYVETDLSHFYVEPWNAISSLAIVIPAVYWAFKLRWHFRDYTFIYFCIPLLFLGGLGSTFFHAFRAHRAVLYLDFMPPAILMFVISLYFWWKVLPKIWMVPFVAAAASGSRFLFFETFPGLSSINSNYFYSGVAIFLPILVYLWKTSLKNGLDVFLSLGLLSLSLVLRERDSAMSLWLPMGSHFLWHIFSGVGAYFLAQFLYKLRTQELNSTTSF